MRAKAALLWALFFLPWSLEAGSYRWSNGLHYRCRQCGWGMDGGGRFDDLLTHFPGKHGVMLEMGYGSPGDKHFCYCDDSPRKWHGDGKKHGKHLRDPHNVLKHLREEHDVDASES